MRADFSKVLEYIPSEDRFLVRAGVGWEPGVVGDCDVGADLASPAGYALRTGKPVISNHLENEERFRTPEILRQHGIHRAMNVILQGDGRPFGVLEVDSRSDDEFVEHDLAFLQGAANLLGMAIERERHERSLGPRSIVTRSCSKEMNHRVKNSLMIVSSMLQLQASEVGDEVLTQHLTEAAQRVTAIGQVHDQLSHGADVERMDIGRYIEAVCRDLDASVPQCAIRSEVQPGIEIASDRAISTALIVNELIANAAKYASPGRPGGEIRVRHFGREQRRARRSRCGTKARAFRRISISPGRRASACGSSWRSSASSAARWPFTPTIRAPSSSSRSRARRRAERA